ncbi:MAG: hypothetical protein HY924_09020 [Elusimicrobia bacterium]|nr:hypothetical protein [Elusimicrobiota bacterium]
MMKMRGPLKPVFLAAVLGMCGASAQAESQRRFVSGQIWKNGSHSFSINEYSLGISLWVNASGSNLYFSGRPFSGSVWGSGTYMTISGSGVQATVSKWGSNYSVRGTFHPAAGGQAVRVDFTMHALGREDDPVRPPSYSVYDGASGANLNLNPSGADGYSISGWVDTEKFGAHGTSLVALVASASLEARPEPKAAQEPAKLPGARLAPLPSPL